ncbi:MAG: hypothetical protein QM820_49500 [Minicystis sp.]
MVERSFSGTLLRFRVLGIPVRVETTFLITTFILGYSGRSSLRSFLSWLGVVFVSVLVHELGHALVGRRFGLEPDIVLYGWGGLTSWTSGSQPSPPRRLAIAIAGPAVGIVLGLACWLAKGAVPLNALQVRRVLDDFVYASAIWGAVNLVPILPLDGGLAFEALLAMIVPRYEKQGARLVSAIAGIGVGVLALQRGWLMVGVFATWLGINSARALVRARREAQDEVLIARYRSVFSDAIENEDGEALTAVALQALREAQAERARTWVLENLAIGRALAEDFEGAVDAIASAPTAMSTAVEGFVVRRAVCTRKRDLAQAAGVDVQSILMGPPSSDGHDAWTAAVEVLRGPLDVEIEAMVFGWVREAGEILRRDGDVARIGERLIERAPDPDLAFALACTWARVGDDARTSDLAKQAVALGFRDWERAAEAPEIARRAFAIARAASAA